MFCLVQLALYKPDVDKVQSKTEQRINNASLLINYSVLTSATSSMDFRILAGDLRSAIGN
jgi:hypothetical protein